eukprot:Hpha_TRINITY_DN15601_c3_g7::TRINITY_DN15601_c3_g7_i1::g.101120::m.101120
MQSPGRIRVFTRQQLRGHFQNDHFAPEARHGLSHLDTDGTGSDQNHVGRHFRKVEEVVVCQMGNLRQGGHHRGASPGGDHRVLEANGHVAALRAANQGGVSVQELGVPQEYVLAEVPAITLHTVVRPDVSAQLAHAAHHFAEVNSHSGGDVNSEVSRRLHLVCAASARNETLGREATDIETVPSHVVALDHTHTLAKSLRHNGAQQPSHPGPDHQQVVRLLLRRSVLPHPVRPHVPDQRPVRLVVGLHRTMRCDQGLPLVAGRDADVGTGDLVRGVERAQDVPDLHPAGTQVRQHVQGGGLGTNICVLRHCCWYTPSYPSSLDTKKYRN